MQLSFFPYLSNIKIFFLKINFRILKKYLSAYILPIFKKANVIKVAIINKNTIVFIIAEIGMNKIPIDITLAIKYNICLSDR